jgi:acyl homoserine lactone synthase
MIKIIPGEWRERYPGLIDEMHKLRRSVFYERLKWQVTVINRWEIDGYDALNPLYVLSLDENERVVGGLRLLPTTGFNMLNDTFPQLLPDGAPVQSPLIWESSRFTVRMTGDARVDFPAISHATAELGMALNEIGKAAALSHIVTVYDRAMHRMLTRVGCAGDPLGPPQTIGGVETYAVLYEVGPEWDARVRALAGGGVASLGAQALETLRARRQTNQLLAAVVGDAHREERSRCAS